MEFASEPWIRVYTRDTKGWRLLGWRGQAVWLLLYRQVDPLGAMGLDGVEPWELGILKCGLPEEVARPGMERCLETGWILHEPDPEPGAIVIPRYQEANSAPTSSTARSREYRAREQAKRDALQRSVTQLCNETLPHDATNRDGLQRNVTGGNGTLLAMPAMGAADPGPELGEIQRLEHQRAAATAAWLATATGLEPFPLTRRWLPSLLFLAGKPEQSKVLAADVLRNEAKRGEDVRRMLNPEHVQNFWHFYGVGRAPGRALPLKAAAPEQTPLEKLWSKYAELDRSKRECGWDEAPKAARLAARMEEISAQIKALKEATNGRA